MYPRRLRRCMLTAKGNSYGTAGTPPTISGWIGGKLPRNRTRSGSLGSNRPWPDVGHFGTLTHLHMNKTMAFDTWSTCPDLKSNQVESNLPEWRSEMKAKTSAIFISTWTTANCIESLQSASAVLTRDNERPKWNENKSLESRYHSMAN